MNGAPQVASRKVMRRQWVARFCPLRLCAVPGDAYNCHHSQALVPARLAVAPRARRHLEAPGISACLAAAWVMVLYSSEAPYKECVCQDSRARVLALQGT